MIRLSLFSESYFFPVLRQTQLTFDIFISIYFRLDYTLATMLDAKGCKTDLPISMFTDYSADDKIKLQAFAQLNEGTSSKLT